MAGRIRIKVTTASDSLCASCDHSRISRDTNDRIRINCRLFGIIRTPIVECSAFKDKYSMDKYEMEEIAWIIDPDRRAIGFNTPVFVPPGSKRHKELTGDD